MLQIMNFDFLQYVLPDVSPFYNKSVVIYGAGKVGRNYYAQLAKYEQVKVSLWVDKVPKKYSYEYHSVLSVNEILKVNYDFIIIAVLKEQIAGEIKNELINIGVPQNKLFWVPPCVIGNYGQIITRSVNRNIIRIQGGLGNQMFQYALYKSLNLKGIPTEANIQAYINPIERPFELFKAFPSLRMDIDAANDFDTYRNPLNTHELYEEKQDGFFDKNVFQQKDVSFNGYWQSEKYFSEIKQEIFNDFTFDLSDAFLKEFAENLIQKDNTVSIHVRRGDYLMAENVDLYGGICTLEYYKKAIAHINKEISEPLYVVFSDDLEWAKKNLSIKDAIFVSRTIFKKYKNWYDMYLMSCCKHNIIANSSFSWWGAWLNKNPEKIVIAPSRFLNGKETPDIWCDGWVKI